MSIRRTKLKPDPRGDFRPYIGVRLDGSPQRFNLGRDLSEAERRRDRIQLLYRESEAARQCYGLTPSWTDCALAAARSISQGMNQVPVPSHKIVNEVAEADGNKIWVGHYDPCWEVQSPEALFWSHGVASRLYPSVNWVLPETANSRQAIHLGQQVFDSFAKRQARLLNATPPKNPVAGTLHEAFDKYTKHVEIEGSRRITHATMNSRLDQVKYLKARHDDVPLAFLDLEACRTMVEFWTCRPVQQNGERYSRHTCKHRVSELSMFFDWLHSTKDFSWRKPEDFDTISKSIVKDSSKRSIRELIAKRTFTVDQLAEINRHCNTRERLLLYLGLNCCFGAAESGRLEHDDFFLRQMNPLSHLWKDHDFQQSDTDSWIAFLRPKTLVAGCWWLWPETVDAFERWLQERTKSNSSRIIVSDQGNSLYRDHSKNGQSGFQNIWNDLLRRLPANGQAEMPMLPFGTLRDQFPNWAVAKGESESGSIALAHGKPFKYDLLTRYANLPFPRLFELQKKYREFMKPVFDTTK